MVSRLQVLLLLFLVIIVECNPTLGNSGKKESVKRIHAPNRNIDNIITNGTLTESSTLRSFDNKVATKSRVSVYTVAWLTLAMAAATGLGAVPFFFLELEPQWAGVCNGLAAGVMLAASFDLVQEGQSYGSGGGGWVVLALCLHKFLEHYGEVSMLDNKGADATKAVLVIGIMTLHSFKEGSGVGVSFAGSEGLTRGLLVTLAITIHNIPEGFSWHFST